LEVPNECFDSPPGDGHRGDRGDHRDGRALTLRGLHITRYSFTGVLLSGVDGFRLTAGRYTDNEE